MYVWYVQNIILSVYKLCCIVILSKHFSPMTSLMYENLSNSTLDELAEYFQELPDLCNCPKDYDVQYGVSYTFTCMMLSLNTTQNGVLSIKVGSELPLQFQSFTQ